MALLQKRGWILDRVRGSHHILRNAEGHAVVVPLHGNEPVSVGIVQQILRKKLKLTDNEIAEL